MVLIITDYRTDELSCQHIEILPITPTTSKTISLRLFRGLAEHQRDRDAQDFVISCAISEEN